MSDDDSSASESEAFSEEESKGVEYASAKPKLWLLDRTRGNSRPDVGNKPPFFLCWVPFPVHSFANVFEQNSFCEAIGKVGCVDHDDPTIRKRVLIFGLTANLFAFFTTVFACFAISEDFDVVRATAFSSGQVKVLATDILQANIDIGLRGVAFENFQSLATNVPLGQRFIGFDDFCGLIDSGLERYLDPAECDSCANVSNSLVRFLVTSLFLIIPSLTTDVLRMWPNYDVNCQKMIGSIISTCSMLLSFYTIYGYNQICFVAFNDGVVPYFGNGTVATSFTGNEEIFEAEFSWKAGPGIMCMFVATALKIIDILANFLIPTPLITRDRDLQEEYERLYGEDQDLLEDEQVDEESTSV